MFESSIAMLNWWIKQLDWCIKADVIELGLCKDVKKIDYGNFSRYILHQPIKKYDDLMLDLTIKHGKYYLDTARKLNNSDFSRVRRLKRRIARYLSLGQCIFATLTFSDDVLNNTNEKTRRKYVQLYLRSKSNHYVANIDFGSDSEYVDRHGVTRKATEREHYHALILKDFIPDKWPYGNALFEKVHKTNSETLIAKYITKLSRHYVKKSVRRNYCIYSRS